MSDLKNIIKIILSLSLYAMIMLVAAGCSKSWKDYQWMYTRLKVGADTSGPNLSQQQVEVGKVLTIQNDELGIRDKCMTCHVGISNPLMKNVDQPFKRHSGKYLQQHGVQEFGCTVCHGGNGESIDEQDAHAGLLRGVMTQVSCTKCHNSDLFLRSIEGAWELSNGMRLLNELNCIGCHRIDAIPFTKDALPDLNGIGSKVNRRWLVRWLQNPKSCQQNATMPVFHLDDESIEALAAYLMTFTDSTLEKTDEPPAGQSEKGGNLLREARCISCHPFNGTGGHLAPDIGKIGNKVHRKWLYVKLKDPPIFQPETSMPYFNLSSAEYSDLVEHLMEEYTDYEMKEEDERPKRSERNDAEFIDRGRRIFKELRCGNCHTYPGEEEWLQLGPILSTIGMKKNADIDFGRAAIERTIPEYFFRKVKQPQLFSTPTNLLKMPDYQLSNDTAKDITIALLSLNSSRVKAKKYTIAQKSAQQFEPEGEFGLLLDKYQCYSCHRINGRGYNLAYDLSIEGSRVQRKWLYDYLMVSYSIRPILVERMPVFRFSPHEAEVLTDGIIAQFVSPKIPKNLEREFTPHMVKLGERIFDGKGCMACHIIGEKGGYVGPSFTIGANAGDKLQAGWVYLWLKNPQAIVQEVLEPNYNLSDEEALALTAYLMNLKNKAK